MVFGIRNAKLETAEVYPRTGREASHMGGTRCLEFVGAPEIIAQREIDLIRGQDVETHHEVVERLTREIGCRSVGIGYGIVRRAPTVEIRQRDMEACGQMGQEKGIVMDGRDIGTVVFPQAELKIFVTASAEVRAQRRYDELTAKGQKVSYDDILRNVQERDYIDSHREVAPLRQAPDALLLDNSHLTIAEQKAWLMEQFRKAVGE